MARVPALLRRLRLCRAAALPVAHPAGAVRGDCRGPSCRDGDPRGAAPSPGTGAAQGADLALCPRRRTAAAVDHGSAARGLTAVQSDDAAVAVDLDIQTGGVLLGAQAGAGLDD